MADIRELLLQDHMGASLFRMPGLGRLASKLKFSLRRFVVWSAFSPLAILYRAIYHAHISYALRELKKHAHIGAIYISRGIASGEIKYGVSDVDLVVFGDWSDEEQESVMKTLRRLSRLSPLYDRSLWQHTHTLKSALTLYATDFYHQFRFDQGRTEWKLVYGDDFLASFPPVPNERAVAGYYMDIRNWWDTFTQSAFGLGITARDPIFRNSIAYKAAAEIINKTQALKNGTIQHSRKKGIDEALEVSHGSDREYLFRLKRSAETFHLRYNGDIQADTFEFLLRLLEDFHSNIGSAPGFDTTPLRLDAPREEILLSATSADHAQDLVHRAKSSWSGYRSAFLVPTISSFNLDDLMLLIEVDPSDTPTMQQLRELLHFHAAVQPRLRQRIALFLLLREGAYQLETVGFLELWHLLMCPAANPDVFTLLQQPDFVLDGTARPGLPLPKWTRYASALIEEEIGVRRAAMSNVNSDVTLTSLELIRNLWRQLQIEIVYRSTQDETVLVPMTPPAIQRAIRSLRLSDSSLLGELEHAYRAELDGTSTDVRALLPEFGDLLSRLP